MIYTPEDFRSFTLVDSKETALPYAFEFNDETCETKFYVTGLSGGRTRILVADKEPIVASTLIPGARMVPRELA